jgi:hypothetical protein
MADNETKIINLTGGVEDAGPRIPNEGLSGPPPSPGFTKVDALRDYKRKDEDLVAPAPSRPYTYDSSKPSICMVGWHTCIRVTKETIPLVRNGWRVGLVTSKLPSAQSAYDKTYTFFDDDQLRRTLEEVKDKYDIIHIHNEPNILLIRAREIMGPKKPILLDVHDLDILRRGFCGEEEILAMSYASGFVHVSEPIEQFANSLYNLNKPSITLESRCPMDFQPTSMPLNRTGIVYEGGIRPPENTADFSYRNIWSICAAFTKEGIPIEYIGPIDRPMQEKYAEAGVNCLGGMTYENLLKTLPRYQWGLSGFIQDPPKKHVTWAMTNKLFEYINCGVPPIVYNTEEQATFIKKYNIGACLDSIHGIRQQLEKYNWEELFNNLMRYRAEIAMDNHIEKLEKLYYRLLG